MVNKKNYEIECSLSAFYSYCYYNSNIRLINRLYIKNLSREDIKDAVLTITSADLIIPYSKIFNNIPYESTIDVDTVDIVLNSAFLLNLSDTKEITVNIELTKGDIICSLQQSITVLPYETFSSAALFPELLSCFIRPFFDIEKILKSAADILKVWKQTFLNGYEGNDKNNIRLFSAAVYRAIQQKNIAEDTSITDIEKPLPLNFAEKIITAKKATIYEMALLYASCLEAAEINSVLILGKNDCLVGTWLIDNCFLDSSFDDISEIKKRSDENINEIAVIDVKQLFAESKQNFSGAEKAAADKILLSENSFNYIIDVKRCRIAGYKPLLKREKTTAGYQITQEVLSLDEMPKDKRKNLRPIKMKPLPAKESQWERRLLDLSLRNSLLNFVPKNNVLHIMSTSIIKTVENLLSGQDFNLFEMPSEFLNYLAKVNSFNTPSKIMPLKELITLEQKNGRLRTFLDLKGLTISTSALYRKEKLSLEETGTSTLYTACGFLKWNYAGEKENFKYAPLVLIPVSLQRKSAGKGYSVNLREEEYQFNTTLLEFLKQEFGLEMRGIDDIKSIEDIESIFTAVKKQILTFKGWEITEDVYIASLSFSRFLMWNDLRSHVEIFKKNKIISSLAQNKLDNSLSKINANLLKDSTEEDENLFIPISADSSQFKAVQLSDKNMSFVLHGPPGTGKSQTITNIIANAIAKNKRVLFVAEKTAALSVVKKRLDAIGIGEFCLELHSAKTAKTEICKNLIETSELKTFSETNYKLKLKQLSEIKETIIKPVEALFKIRRLGISVYEGILKTKEFNCTSDFMKIDSSFYEKLTDEKLKTYEGLLSELVAVSKECGQIYRSPFENVGLTTFEDDLMPNVNIAVKILQEEARHLKTYTEMCFEVMGGRVRIITRKKLVLLKELCNLLIKPGNPYRKLFENAKGNDAVKVLNNFISIYKEYEKQEEKYNLLFKAKIELPASCKMLREELEIFPIEFFKSKPLKMLVKKIMKASKQRVKTEHLREAIETVLVYNEIKTQTANSGENLSELLSGNRGEKVNYNQVADFILQLDGLFNAVTKLFTHYDSESFNRMLKNLFAKYPVEIFNCFLKAYDSFEYARQNFFKLLEIEKDYADIDEDYTEFLSLKAAAINDNIDMLSGWCRFNIVSKKLKSEGLKFALEPLIEGKISSDDILSCFNKQVYTDFVEKEIAEDDILSKFSSAITEEKIEKFKTMYEEFERITQQEIRLKLIERLPSLSTEGVLSVELMQLQRAYKSNMRGFTIRNIFSSQKNLIGVLAPCLLMSPGTIAQYLEAEADMFDLVVFDEASQIPTAEAVGAIARGKNAVIVGDPKQLPPTSFFNTSYTDEDNLQFEDLESILEDCLALGLPERYLKWHYRSKHESLIAFSNASYYGNKLCTFPSVDALVSKVQLKYIENGVYDRGRTKQNAIEADCLVAEVVKRLSQNNKGQSIGIVTFSIAQQTLIENKLSDALIRNRLESVAYDNDEPLFVKNLENVQGDERDFILFSVCYGPDRYGRLSLNFGPVNQSNGWRRLNVATSRAREEMVIFSSITSAMIDLSKNNSKGVAGIKAFLEFAQNGKSMLAVKSSYVENIDNGIGKFIAKDLQDAGIDCRYNLGVSDFKIDVAVLDSTGKKFVLAIICDSRRYFDGNEVKDGTVLQIKTLKRLNWNVCRIWTLNYINNPKREIKKIKQLLDRISGKTVTAKTESKYQKPYIEAEIKSENVLSYFILDEANENAIKEKLKQIVEAEQPIAKDFLIKKCMLSYGLIRSGVKINARMNELTEKLDCKFENINGVTFYTTDDNFLKCEIFRTEESGKIKRSPAEISPYEYTAAAKSILADRLSLYIPDLVKEIAEVLTLGRVNTELDKCIRAALEYANKRGMLTISVSNMVTL